METLQLAQMLADLSDLDAAEPRAAHSLVNASKEVATVTAAVAMSAAGNTTSSVVSSTIVHHASAPEKSPAQPRQHRRAASSSGPIPRSTGTASPFDSYLGRRLMTPPITRSSSSHGSMPGTPRANETDSDVDRAASLMALYELRTKLRQYNDDNSLRQAREKVAALSARQPPADTTATQASATSSPRPPAIAHRHSQYTYPRS